MHTVTRKLKPIILGDKFVIYYVSAIQICESSNGCTCSHIHNLMSVGTILASVCKTSATLSLFPLVVGIECVTIAPMCPPPLLLGGANACRYIDRHGSLKGTPCDASDQTEGNMKPNRARQGNRKNKRAFARSSISTAEMFAVRWGSRSKLCFFVGSSVSKVSPPERVSNSGTDRVYALDRAKNESSVQPSLLDGRAEIRSICTRVKIPFD